MDGVKAEMAEIEQFGQEKKAINRSLLIQLGIQKLDIELEESDEKAIDEVKFTIE